MNGLIGFGEYKAPLSRGWQSAGEHCETFDASGLPAGVYFYRLQNGKEMRMNTMVVVK
jgi:hypothetical protein